MKKALLIASVLFIAVITTACINNIAVQELNNKAAEYMTKGDYESAVNRLQASIDLDSSMYETYYNLGIAATSAKKYDIATEAFQNGIKIKPNHVDFYYSLAIAQSEYADDILNKETDEELTEEEKNKTIELKSQATVNAMKYLELNPEAKDKEVVEHFIEELENIDTNKEEEQPKVLEG